MRSSTAASCSRLCSWKFHNGEKLQGYFSLASLQHQLIVDPDRHVVIDHRRGEGADIITRLRRSGELRLAPPGIVFQVEAIFERA